MEALVILFGEFLFALFGALIALCGQLLLLVIGAVLESVAFLFGRSLKGGEKRAPVSSLSHMAQRAGPGLKIAVRTLGVVTAVAVLLAVLVNTVWFEPSFRWLAKRVSARTGIELSFAGVQGSYFSGKMELNQLKVHRAGDPSLNFDFAVQDLKVALSPMRVLERPVRLDSLVLNHVRGTVQRIQQAPPAREKGHADILVAIQLKPRRSFQIDRLNITDGKLHIQDQQADDVLDVELVVDSLESAPLRADYAAFDLLFRSSATGSLQNRPFSVQTSLQDGGQSTSWKAEGLPVSIPRHFIGGLFKCVIAGTVDVDVTDYWKLGDATEIDMAWSMTFRQVEAELPEDLSKFEAKLAGAAVKYINENGEELPLAFGLRINEEEFKGSASLKASGLFTAVSEALLKEVAVRLGQERQDVKESFSSGFKKFQRFLDDKRKNPAEEAE